jgi:hypothetical protein
MCTSCLAYAPDLAVDDVETAGEIYNVFTIEGGRITRIEDYLQRRAARAAAAIKAPQPESP